MKTILQTLLFCVAILFAFPASAQQENHDHSNEHKHHLGVGFAASHISEKAGLKPGFHIHYLRQIGESEHWAMGLGYESVLTDPSHNSVNFLMNFRPIHMISINAGPGLVFGKHEDEFEVNPAFHTEAVLEFEINKLHIGPLIGYGFDKEDSHFSFGIHLGFGL
jgi:hypothetical protein